MFVWYNNQQQYICNVFFFFFSGADIVNQVNRKGELLKWCCGRKSVDLGAGNK